MSMRTLFIWIIIAGMLGGAVLAIRAQQAKAMLDTQEPTTRTLGFDQAGTIELSRVVENEHQVLQRDAAQPDLWTIQWTQGGADYSWEADPTIVRSGLRALATARVRITQENPVSQSAGELLIRQRSGGSIGIEFDSASAGGYTGIRVEERDSEGVATRRWYGRIEKTIYDAFIDTGILHWRSDRLFSMPRSAVRSASLEAGGAKVGLERTSAGWVVTEPYRIHAQREKIEELVNIVLALRSAKFVDEAVNPKTTGLDSPVAVIRLSASDGPTTLTIGGRADVGGDTVYGRLESSTGSALLTLGTSQLSKLTADPMAYIGHIPSGLSSSRIRGVRILGKDDLSRFEAMRVMGDWMIDGTKADSVRRDALDRLIAVLTNDEAQAVRVFDRQEVPPALGTIELLGESGKTLDRFGVALDSTEAGMRMLVMEPIGDDRVVLWAAASDDAAASGAWLTAVASKRVRP
jgi:Domain of unknown function (DUF4340)